MYTKTTAVGRLTKDPEERAYGSGQGKMALFTIAVDTGKDETQFYDSIAFGKTAEMVLNYLKKGEPVVAEGVMQNNNHERKTKSGDSYTNYGMTFLVNYVHFLSLGQGKQQGGQSNSPQARQQNQQQQQGGFNQQQGGFGQATNQEQQSSNPFSGFSGSGDDGVPF